MTAAGWIQLVVLIVAHRGHHPVLGRYMAKVYGRGTAPGDRVFGPSSAPSTGVAASTPTREQRWTTYALSLLAFSLVSVLVLYALQRCRASAAQPGHAEGGAAPICRSTPPSAS